MRGNGLYSSPHGADSFSAPRGANLMYAAPHGAYMGERVTSAGAYGGSSPLRCIRSASGNPDSEPTWYVGTGSLVGLGRLSARKQLFWRSCWRSRSPVVVEQTGAISVVQTLGGPLASCKSLQYASTGVVDGKRSKRTAERRRSENRTPMTRPKEQPKPCAVNRRRTRVRLPCGSL